MLFDSTQVLVTFEDMAHIANFLIGIYLISYLHLDVFEKKTIEFIPWIIFNLYLISRQY